MVLIIENLKELIVAIEGFETLPTFLEHVSLVMENEASMVEAYGGTISVIEGSTMNFKITTTDDWELAEINLRNENT